MARTLAVHSLTPRLFALASLALLISASLLRVTQSTGLDIYLFDTYFAVLHPQFLLVAGILQGIFAVIYFAFPTLTRDAFRETLGRLHFWLTAIAMAFIFSTPYVASRIILEGSWRNVGEEFLAAGPVFLLVGQVPFFLLFGRDKVKSI